MEESRGKVLLTFIIELIVLGSMLNIMLETIYLLKLIQSSAGVQSPKEDTKDVQGRTDSWVGDGACCPLPLNLLLQSAAA